MVRCGRIAGRRRGAVAWPNAADKIFPGAGEKAAALRSSLGPVAGLLPAYQPPAPAGRAAADAASGGQRAGGQGGGGQRGGGGGGGPGANRPPVLVVLDTAQRSVVPVVHDAVGTVQPMAVVAIKSRVDAQVQEVAVPDGATVKAGQLLAQLDSRQVEAQIKQAEASLARNRTVLEQANGTWRASRNWSRATPAQR